MDYMFAASVFLLRVLTNDHHRYMTTGANTMSDTMSGTDRVFTSPPRRMMADSMDA
jgi:hypothetical protein